MMGDRFVSRLLKQLPNGKLVCIEIVFCDRKEMYVGFFDFCAEIAELNCLFLKIDSVDVDKIHFSQIWCNRNGYGVAKCVVRLDGDVLLS